MIQDSKINFVEFISYIKTCTITDYVSKFPYPILLGQKIMTGDIREMTMHSYDQTFLFEQEGEGNSLSPNAIKRIMHMLYMKRDMAEENDVYTIGRIDRNDIVLVDYTISKAHAKILLRDDGYYLVDNKSKNGTSINGNPLIPNREYAIKEKDILIFGRIGFVFIRPISLFIRFRLLKKTPKEMERDCMLVIKMTSIDNLCNILKKFNLKYPTGALDQKSIARELFNNIDPVSILIALCS